MRRTWLLLAASCWTGSPPAPEPAAAPAAPAAAPQPSSLAEQIALGERTYQRTCSPCHTIDGSPRIGPSWRGIWDTDVSLADGRVVRVDAAYVRRSILQPNADFVAGYPQGVMPTFAGMLAEAQIAGVIAFIASLR
jgi:mono/diheme cytochrome c family protein